MVTLGELRTGKKVLRYMKKELAKSYKGKESAETELTQNILSVLIEYANDLGEEIKKKGSK